MKRYKMKRSSSKRRFKRGFRTPARNYRPPSMRGGTRL